eukprot:CAMPEP_0173323274 /NCGR_PEP_ID=MMETSP1143-20121109/30438_1 /TAXON_ID=483371 /ORGANISM="non described non described, Strain CCMP2298" /LENGTH=78 /DNA_ID=CAMNT_0014267245 /DNA_START=581 /DNA_END=816 /DNA_ORIENTATION=+
MSRRIRGSTNTAASTCPSAEAAVDKKLTADNLRNSDGCSRRHFTFSTKSTMQKFESNCSSTSDVRLCSAQSTTFSSTS